MKFSNLKILHMQKNLKRFKFREAASGEFG
jgi:hypothetical protein